MARAESSRTPWTILRGIFHWATLSVKGFLVFMLCITGYMFGAAFFIAALAKPFNPRAVGLWMIGHDSFSLRLGMTDSVANGHELLGWFLIPIGCSLGGGTIHADHAFRPLVHPKFSPCKSGVRTGRRS